MFRTAWSPRERTGSVTSPLASPLNSPSYTQQQIPKPPSPASPPYAESSQSRQPHADDQPPAYVGEAPPDYTPLDEGILVYTLSAPLISAGTSFRYQLKLQRTRTGKPSQICIRRLMPTESRRLSRATSIGSASSAPSSIGDYDDDSTMYTITKLSITWSNESIFEIKGQRASTLPGLIRLERADRLGNRKWSFQHHKRNPANDMLKPENAKKMAKYGYHPDDEWTKTTLFSASGFRDNGKLQFEWRNGLDQPIVREHDDSLTFHSVLEPRMRDLLVTCWIARLWNAGTLKWPGEIL